MTRFAERLPAFLKSQSPEFFIFLIYPLLIGCLVLWFPDDRLHHNLRHTGGVQGVLYFLKKGPLATKILVFTILIYLPWRCADWALTHEANLGSKCRELVLSGLTFFVGVMALGIADNLLLAMLALVPAPEVYLASVRLISVESAIWQGLPAFSVQQHLSHNLMDASIVVYSHCVSVHLVAFVGALLFSVPCLRRLYTSLWIWVMLAIPVWLLLPAISPQELCLENMLRLAPDVFTQLGLPTSRSALSATPALHHALDEMSRVWSDAENHSYAITTFPSFHVGAAIIVSHTLSVLWRPTIIFTIPFIALTMLGATVTLQHWTVDFIPGALLAILAIRCADRWIAASERNSQIPSMLRAVETFQRDAQRIIRAIAGRTKQTG